MAFKEVYNPILLVKEAVRAIKRKRISDKKLFRMLNGFEIKDEPSSEETRQLAYEVLHGRGFHFTIPEKVRKTK